MRLDFNLEVGATSAVTLRAMPGDRITFPNGDQFPDHPLIKLIESLDREETGMTHMICDSIFVKPDQSASLRPAGEWNSMEVEARGHELRVSVNGKKILHTTVDPGARFPDGTIPALNRETGRIGLQKHTGTVRFRNLEIKDFGPERPR